MAIDRDYPEEVKEENKYDPSVISKHYKEELDKFGKKKNTWGIIK